MSKTMVYIGPSMEGVVMTGTAFAGGYPPRVQGLISKEPYLFQLTLLRKAGKHYVNRRAD